jgi:predicted AlkP superfamily phosphohydrolase/phosphomutase
MGEKKKMVIIGIDGGSFNVIDPLVERGELPHLARLMRGGCSGDLRSTYPPITHVAWSTFATGKNPGKHGVFDFIEPPHRNDENTPFYFTNFNAIKCATFWQILQKHGLKIGIVNLPMAYPPTPVNGFLITGIDTPSEEVIFTYPENLITELKEQGIYYRPDYVEFLRFKKGQAKYRNLEDVRQDYFEIEEERRKAVLWLMKEKEWDLLVVVLSLPDRVKHHFWPYHDCNGNQEKNPFRNVVEDSYRKVDQIVGEMLDLLENDIPIMLMSDHGFGTFDKLFHTNHWLWENGFLSLKKIHPFNFWKYFRLLKIKKTTAGIFTYLRLGFLAKRLPTWLATTSFTFFMPFPNGTPERIDWENTQAYAGAHGIYINLKDRTPRGIVQPGPEYEDICNKIIDRLQKAVDPETGENFVETLLKREDAFDGPFVKDAPDILISTKELKYLPSTNYYFRKGFRKKKFGNHKMEGILILHGPQFKRDSRLNGAHIQDCMPTIFYTLGVPIPEDFDGQILEKAFDEEYARLNPPEFTEPMPFEPAEKAIQMASTYTAEESEMIHERLKSLGYID